MAKVGIGIVGSQFQADCIATSVKAMPEEAEVVAVASPTPGNAESFARRHGIPAFYVDHRELLRDPRVEIVHISAPNYVHARITIDAARAGKHVICEKPLCVTLDEADEMIDACKKAGVLLLYAEELFFAPKYVKAKQMADEGASGRIHDSIEIFGATGQTYADMLMGNALPTYSEVGFGYAVEKASSTKGWTYPVFEEHWNYGFPQEMRHFARCVRGKETPIADGETGRVVQEVLYAAYASAGQGKKIALPFRPKGVKKPIDLWKNP